MPRKTTQKKLIKGLSQKNVVFILSTLIVLGLLLIVNRNLNIYTKSPTPINEGNQKDVLAAEVDTEKEILFWQDFLDRNPEYYPGWIELSKLEVQAGDIDSAKEALNNAIKIKPNDKDVSEVQALIDTSE